MRISSWSSLSLQMNNLIFPFFFCLLTLLSCQEDGIDNHQSVATKSNLVALKIVDSIKINTNSFLYLTDYDPIEKQYLFFDIFTSDIRLTDQKGKEKFTFNKTGGGPKEYANVRGVSFLPPNQVLIIESWGYKIFDRSGNFIKGGKFKDSILAEPLNGFLNVAYLNEQNQPILAVKGSTFDMGQLQDKNIGLQHNWLTLYNVAKDTFLSGVQYDQKMYGTKQYPGGKSPLFDYNPKEKVIHAVFPLEPFIYTYDLQSLDLLSKKPTNASFFSPPVGVSLDLPLGHKKLQEADLKNAKYKAIYYLPSNRLVTHYETKIPEELIKNTNQLDLEKKRKDSRKGYLQIYNNLQKIGGDIPIPKGLTFRNAFALDHLLFYAKKEQESTELVVYLGEIELSD